MAKLVMRECKRCGRRRAERFFVGTRGKLCVTCRKRRVSHASREVRLMETHFITLEEDAALLAAQDGVCAICKGARPYELDVDHDHAVERALLDMGVTPALAHRRSIRGKLCKRCNRRLLPSAGDSVDRLQAAIDYIEHPPAVIFEVLGAGDTWVS